MFVPYIMVELKWYVADAALKGAGSCVGCLGVIDAALGALVAEEGADVRHVVVVRAKELKLAVGS